MGDNSCSMGVKKREKARMEACMEREETRYVENTKLFKEQNSELAKKMCQEFNQTYGRCLRHEFPTCFSERDVNFLRKEIEEVFKAGKHAVEEINNESNRQTTFAFTLFECIKSKSLASELSFDRDSRNVQMHAGEEEINTGRRDKGWTFLLLIMISSTFVVK